MMNKLTKVGEISATMQEMQKEMMKVRAQPRRGCSGAGSGCPAGAQVGIAEWFACLTLRRALSQAGVIEAAVAAMRAHPQDEDMQLQGVETLYRVCDGFDAAAAARWRRASEAGAKAAVRRAVAAFPDNNELVRRARRRDSGSGGQPVPLAHLARG